MKVELEPGEQVTVAFSEGDGEITVAFNEYSITVHADLEDATGRAGIIYEEKFGPELDDKDESGEGEGR